MSKLSPKRRLIELQAWMAFMNIKPKEKGYTKYTKYVKTKR